MDTTTERLKIPAQYLPVMPYLLLNNASGFLAFVKKVFNATEQMIVPDNDKIRHGEIKIFDAVIMFADAVNDWPEKTAGMFIYVKNLDRIYAEAENAGAKSLMKPVKQDYGYTAGIEDPFGNQWWLVEAE